jgi:hypothetical protein
MDDKVHEGLMYMKKNKAMVIQCDNQGTISLSKNPMQHVQTKHIDFNIILLEYELKMVKSCLNIVQWRTWWQLCLPKHCQENDITN